MSSAMMLSDAHRAALAVVKPEGGLGVDAGVARCSPGCRTLCRAGDAQERSRVGINRDRLCG